MPTRSDGQLSDAQRELCRGFLDRALARLGENLELLLGLDPRLSVESLGVESDARTRAALFPNAIGFPLQLSGALPDPIHLLVEPMAARSMLALSRLASPEEIEALREESTPLTSEDRQGLREVAEFVAAAFTDETRANSGSSATFQAGQPIVLADSRWESGHDPIAATSHLVVRGDLGLVEEGSRDAYVLLVPWGVLGEMVAGLVEAPRRAAFSPLTPAASSEPVTAPDEAAGTLLLAPTGAPEALNAILGECTRFGRASQLLAALEDGAQPRLLVTRVGIGEEYLLSMVAALRHHPAVARTPLLVLLEQPTRRVVLRCGELGLLDVLPTDAPLPVARARVRALASPG